MKFSNDGTHLVDQIIASPENVFTWDAKPAASEYIGTAWFSDINAMGYSDGVNWYKATSEIRPTKIALMGDSTGAQNSTATAYLIQGPINWMLRYLGFPVEYQPSDNYSVGGATTRTCIDTQIPLLEAGLATNNYSRCFISIGTNDTTLTIAERISVTAELFEAVRAMGIIPVSVGIRPRGSDVADTTAKKTARALNAWIYNQSLLGLVEYVDISAAYADTSTAFGNMVTATSADALHPSPYGAMLEGKILADAYSGKLGPKILQLATEQADKFDRTSNPYGVAFGSITNPLMIGGTTAPTGYSSSGGTWSKATRTLPNGQTRSDPQCVLSASTVHYLLASWVTTGDWATTELQPGDIVEGRAKVVVTSGVNISRIELRMTESDGVTAVNITDGNDPASSYHVDGTYTIYLKTPRRTIRSYGGSGNAYVELKLLIQTIGGGSGTVNVHGFEIRPVHIV